MMSTWLVMPWRTSHASMRWLMLVLMAGALVTTLILGIHVGNPNAWRSGTALCSASVAFAWAFWLSAGTLTAIDARGLRLPGAERAVVYSLLLWGALTTGVPALLLGALGAHVLHALLWLAIAASAGLAFALLPRWCAIVMGFLPMLGTGLAAHALLPPWHTLMTPPNGAGALLALLVTVVWRWRVVLQKGRSNALGFGSAFVLQQGRQGTGTDSAGLGQMVDGSALIRQRPDWLQPKVAMRNAGPAAPVRALRMALGGMYLPKTLGSHLRPLVFPVLILLVASALLTFEGNGGSYTANTGAIGPAIAFAVVLFAGLGTAFGADALVRSRWKKVNAELPLLALLPGLGNAAAQRRHLLRSVLGTPVAFLLVLFVGVLVAPRFVPLHGLGLLLIALTPLAVIANLAASTLGTLGNRRPPCWGEWLRYGWLMAVILIGTIVPVTTLGAPPSNTVDGLERATLLGWIALMPGIAWLAWRGWHAFRRRPHPFLPTVD